MFVSRVKCSASKKCFPTSLWFADAEGSEAFVMMVTKYAQRTCTYADTQAAGATVCSCTMLIESLGQHSTTSSTSTSVAMTIITTTYMYVEGSTYVIG